MVVAPDIEPVIRAATAQDVDDIHALLIELAVATNMRERMQSSPGDLLRSGFGEHPEFEALLAVHDGQSVGLTVYFYEYSTWRGRTGAYLQDIVVMPDFRGTGLAQRLMRATAKAVQLHGASYLRLSVDARNDGAIDFYHSIGMEMWTDERIFVAEGAAFKHLTGDA